MAKKQERTPKSRIRSTLRQLFLRSRERASVIKRDKNTCQECGKKGSVAKGREIKIEVHHLTPIEWENIFAYIYRHLLTEPKDMLCLCKDCHKKETEKAQG